MSIMSPSLVTELREEIRAWASVYRHGLWKKTANGASKRGDEDRGDDSDRGNTSSGDDGDRNASREDVLKK